MSVIGSFLLSNRIFSVSFNENLFLPLCKNLEKFLLHKDRSICTNLDKS